jgi:multidrug efflux pump subunit AcrA (membrane-fusion protein)
VDIGDRVHKGQLLATINAPDLDQQVAQARSTLQQSQSNLNQTEAQFHLATLTWNRYKVLVAKGVFSRQDGDTQEANFRVAEANVRALENAVQSAKANLDRLIVLQQYENVTAPFDGVVTARNVDVGALISAQGTGLGSSQVDLGGTQVAAQTNNGGTSGTPPTTASPPTGGAQGGQMFQVAKVDPLRILVSVPEGYAFAIHVGQRADLHFQEIPRAEFPARVTRTAGAIDQNTRTMLVEVQAGNSSRQLLPGMYVVVNFTGAKGERPLLVPGEAIVVRDGKTMIAKVRDNVVHFQSIEIGRDYGEQTEIVDGVNPGDVIATNISDEVREGAKINPQYEKESERQPGGQSDRKPGGDAQYGNQGVANKGAHSVQQGGGKQGNSSKRSGSNKQQ